MASARHIDDAGRVVLLRPLLAVSGARLRATLHQLGMAWIDDPSNEADRFERVRLRKARALLAGIGLDNDKLALSARRLARARTALDAAAVNLGRTAQLDLHAGAFASFERSVWLAAPEETRLRLLGQLIAAYGGQSEPFRLAPLEALVARLGHEAFEGATLAGAIIARHGVQIRVQREPGRAALPSLTLDSGTSAVWDRRFRVGAAPASRAAVIVRALGTEAYARLRQQLRVADIPASAAATLPAFWRGEELVFVPYFAGRPGASPGWASAARLYSAEFIG
jgi:tRNA(Ile)-lysidine synthase